MYHVALGALRQGLDTATYMGGKKGGPNVLLNSHLEGGKNPRKMESLKGNLICLSEPSLIWGGRWMALSEAAERGLANGAIRGSCVCERVCVCWDGVVGGCVEVNKH